MKPIKLTMQAFGPFAGKQIIDFTLLGNNPLFLINGPTGAGKTTILDAICYALYGTTTGNEREGSDMRCDYADAGLLTQVEFEFMLGDARYRMLRIPEQERKKEKGEGTTKQAAKITLWQLEGGQETVLGNAVRAVDEKIHALTGLKADQFRQVMVLPQGKFREFLMADSRKREEIFSTLFQTQVYQKIQDKLKEIAGTINRDYQDYQQQKAGVLQGVHANTEQDLEERQAVLLPALEKSRQEKETADSSFTAAKQALATANGLLGQFAEMEKKQQALEQCLAAQNDIAAKATQLQHARKASQILHVRTAQSEQQRDYEDLVTRVAEKTELATAASALLAAAEARLIQAKTAAEAVEPARQQRQQLEGYLPGLQQLAEARQQQEVAARKLESANADFENSAADMKQQQQTVETLREEIEDLRKVVAGEAQASLAASTAAQLVQQKEILDKLEGSTRQKTEAVQVAEAKFNQQAEVVKQADTAVKQLKLQWHSNQAVLLARELEDGQPCPVCGSESHPQPAEQDDTMPLVEREHVEAAEQQLLQEQQQQGELATLMAGLQADLAGVRQRVDEQRSLLGEHAVRPLAELQSELAVFQAQVTHITNARKQLEQKEQLANALQEKLVQLTLQLEQLKQAVTDAQVLSAETTTACQLIEQQVPENWRDQQHLHAEMDRLANLIDTCLNGLQQAEQQLKDANTASTAAAATLSQVQQQLQAAQEKAQQALLAWQAALAENGFADEPAFDAVCLPEQAQQQLQASIENYHNEKLALQTTCQNLQEQLAGKSLPDLQALQAQADTAETAKQVADQHWAACNSESDAVANAIRELARLNRDAEALHEQYQLYGTLSDLANNGSAGQRISLQRFVLGGLLDKVLTQATQRLVEMSKGRYLLLRSGSSRDGRRTAGLDLSILDEYTGKERPVATLSGGESFMAALSLALGLSDVVQAYAGGIRLDTLFIDEGFGSLDTESLDLAIRTLVDLQATGRTIGIISHVSELKEQMPLRLDVIASRQGSSVHMVV